MLDVKPFIKELMTSMNPPAVDKGVDPVEKFNEDNDDELKTKSASEIAMIKEKDSKEFQKEVEKAEIEVNSQPMIKQKAAAPK